MKLAELHEAINLVCPIIGINSNGDIWFADDATEQQKLDAEEIMAENIESLEVV